ncbi:hypothetical protein OVS_03410 [Mycoplasma ovis str. Michigan]|uniref:Uncharacterized protein n=1 Tax=Mycoplasma ovis str. Michigan TaxID=1415773 RepID=A0ABN4BSB8_9MOLU|nr:hypothetical protein OVS_03410 [Mycoplasma ovis str. Michigan]
MKNIEEALSIIWKCEEFIKTQKTRENLRIFNSKDWEDWNVNTFRFFYLKEEFENDIQLLQSNALAVYKLQQDLERNQAKILSGFKN